MKKNKLLLLLIVCLAVVSVFVEAGGLFGGGDGFALEEGKLRRVHLLPHQRFDGGGVLRALRVREGHLRL